MSKSELRGELKSEDKECQKVRMKIQQVISHKRKMLASEISKMHPNKTKIKRLKDSIKRHLKEMEAINRSKKKQKWKGGKRWKKNKR